MNEHFFYYENDKIEQLIDRIAIDNSQVFTNKN